MVITRFKGFLTYILLLVFLSIHLTKCEITSGRIKGDDEPRLVSWRVLEGITEPFESNEKSIIPVWKQMKNAADQKAADFAIQQALHEYGQLLRHPYMFGEMPADERYDVFLSMAKLLKLMGFHQRAELLLYEAMSHTTSPYEAHLQLGLLFLDKEDIETAKMHFKNCLYFQESDILILVHLSVILLAEGRLHEAKFFISRIINGLESKVNKLSHLMSDEERKAIKDALDYRQLTLWLEDTMVKVLYGEFRISPATTIEMLRYFSNLYMHLLQEELFTGRFLFDLGQALYEGGRPRIGKIMMDRGLATADVREEGFVSYTVIQLRVALDYPIVPNSLLDIVIGYYNITSFLSNQNHQYHRIDIENSMDVYWSVPLLAWSGLPTLAVVNEILWRFEGRSANVFINSKPPLWYIDSSKHDHFFTAVQEQYNNYIPNAVSNTAYNRRHLTNKNIPTLSGINENTFTNKIKRSRQTTNANTNKVNVDSEYEEDDEDDASTINNKNNLKNVGRYDDLLQRQRKEQRNKGKSNIHLKDNQDKPQIESPLEPSFEYGDVKINIGIIGGHMNNHVVGLTVLKNILSLFEDFTTTSDGASNTPSNCGRIWREVFNITLLATALKPDAITKLLASKVQQVINLPVDMKQSIMVLEEASKYLDIVLFPDYQPFPDIQTLILQQRRIAPMQLCMYVLGGGGGCSTSSSSKSDIIDYYLLPEELQDFYMKSTPAAASNAVLTFNTSLINSSNRIRKRRLRPAWRELYHEQVLLVDYPILTAHTITTLSHTLQSTASNANNNNNDNKNKVNNHNMNSAKNDLSYISTFSPLEVEGKVFFEGQPVAVLPVFPGQIHPLMDETLLKLLRYIDQLQILLVLPEDSSFSYSSDSKQKMSWARKLVRRLWNKGGNLHQRIRLLPYPLPDQRLAQLLRQVDLVLDTFPVGLPLNVVSLALSVGTPVVTLASGSKMTTSKGELREIKQYLASIATSSNNTSNGINYDHPLRAMLLSPSITSSSSKGLNPSEKQQHNAAAINNNIDIPWMLSISNVAGFYRRTNHQLVQWLVANNTLHYFDLATQLLTDREFSYSVRVNILEAVDSILSTNTKVTQKNNKDKTPSIPINNVCDYDGLGRALYRLGYPFATLRVKEDHEEALAQVNDNKKATTASTRKKTSIYGDDFDIVGSGAII